MSPTQFERLLRRQKALADALAGLCSFLAERAAKSGDSELYDAAANVGLDANVVQAEIDGSWPGVLSEPKDVYTMEMKLNARP